ncbi:KRAB [Lepeophtheirus salmonis]|uniref:KRAB n=1 Tax=Lepeophtheirus salmonis TaxID=72036 RepID=A0A7R8H7Q2_LEPSM|nr:KRAB [Lepeophtheirus salmonis]CAF2924981.1 KRAB [Lepeophtheirus salmonis]
MEVIPSPEDCEEKEVKEEKGNCVDSLISEGDYNNDCKEPIVLDDDEDYIPPNKKESNNHLPPDISFECCFCQTVIYTQDDVFIHCKSMHVGRAVVIKVKDGPAIKYMGSLTEFTCGECRKEIHSVNDLNNHIAGHIIDYKHRKTKPKESRLKNQYRSCLMCSCVFETFFALKKHNEIEHPSEGSLYECQKCGEVFNQCSTYLRHKMYSHTKKERKEYQALSTNTTTSTFTRVNHMCALFVENNLVKIAIWSKHKARVHPQSLDFVCNICGKKCATNEYLRYHIKVRHSESLPYSKHSNNPEKYQCHLCDKSYMNKTFLTNHIDVIHNGLKLFCCQICGKTCSSAHNLKLHENLHEETLIHKDQEELKLLECEECGKTFRISKDLRAHIKVVHKQIKDFKCDICDKAFSFRTHLKRHKQTIHDESCEYKCHVCSVLFFQKPSLRKHLEKVHNINSTTSSNSL